MNAGQELTSPGQAQATAAARTDNPTGVALDDRTRLLMTGSEAYPALERLFLSATCEIRGSFLVFDLSTLLRSAEAMAIGRTWFDLVVHTLGRGVRIDMVVSDVDPIMRPRMHRAAWRTVRAFIAAAEIADAQGALRIRASMHSGETGLAVRVALWPVFLPRLRRIAAWLNGQPSEQRLAALRDMPGIAWRLVMRRDGTFRPRRWPAPQVFPGTHHQKMCVVDGRYLYIGGLDLDERRFDSPLHDRPSPETWHDVQLVLDGGPEVAAAEAHLATFLDTIERRQDPPPQAGLLRTLSRKRVRQHWHLGPDPVLAEIANAHFDAIPRTRRLIYMESQYFRDRKLAKALAEAAEANPHLSLIMILPGAPDDLAFERKLGLDVRGGEWLQSRCLRRVYHAFGPRIFVGCPAQRRRWRSDHPLGRDGVHNAPIIYVHAKVSIFDDDLAIVGSANLNGRSLRWDTESAVVLRDDSVAALRRRVMSHWLPPDASPGYLDPLRSVRLWRNLALENVALPPERRRGFIVPYDVRKAERDGRRVLLLPEELV